MIEIIKRMTDLDISSIVNFLVVLPEILIPLLSGPLILLLSILTRLKEVKQSLFFNYYIRSRPPMVFVSFLVLSLLIVFIASVGSSEYLDQLLGLCKIFLFCLPIVFILLLLVKGPKKWLYDQLLKGFKSDFEKIEKVEYKGWPRNIPQSKYLYDFLENLTYIENKSKDFAEEIKFIKDVGRVLLETDKDYVLNEFFEHLKEKIQNLHFFYQLRNSLYDLTQDYFNDLTILVDLQNIYTSLSLHSFSKTKEFDENLNTDGLMIKSFFDIRYANIYKKSSSEEWIKDYKELANNTINNLFKLCKEVMYLDIELNSKKRYLTEQLSSMVKTLEYYDSIDGKDFLDNYYDLKHKRNLSENEKKSLELADKKLKIIKNLKEILRTKVSELFYLILYKIDYDELQRDFFEITLKIFEIKDFKKYYYNYCGLSGKSRELDFLSYDRFKGGAQKISHFNFNKYKTLMSFYRYTQAKKSDISEYSAEHFSEYRTSDFQNQITSLTPDFVNKYFFSDNEKLDRFKKKVEKEVSSRVETLRRNERKYIAETALEEEYVNKFRSDCKTDWNRNQNTLKKFLKYSEKKGGESVRNSFGTHPLFDKKWFLASFDRNVSLVRSSGEDFGIRQVISKNKNIFSKIDGMFDKKLDEEIIIKDFYADLKKIIGKNEIYFLFYNSDLGRKKHEIPDVEWENDHFAWNSGCFKVNNSKVYLYPINIENSVLFKKDSFILEQFKEGYKNIKETLVVQVEEIKGEEEIQKIKKSNPNFKTDEDVQQKVKVRIAEKFEIKRNDKATFFRLKV